MVYSACNVNCSDLQEQRPRLVELQTTKMYTPATAPCNLERSLCGGLNNRSPMIETMGG